MTAQKQPIQKPEEQLFILRPNEKGVKEVFAVLIAFVSAWMDKCALEIIVRPFKMKRSDLQNRYLHGWIFRKQLMKKLYDGGYRTDDGAEYDMMMLKAMFKHPYFADQIIEPVFFTVNGTEFREEFHPSELPRDKFAKYCELICWASAEKWKIEIEPPMSGHWRQIYEELKLRPSP